MKGKMSRFWPIITVMVYITGSCAKQATPTGGPKDTEPPKIVKSVPLNSTVNFKGKIISVTFDEYVVLDKMNEKFMVSPPMIIKPKISLKGKNLIIEFQEELKDSTTYTLYFQDAIRDLNEANPLNNFQFVFSTGKVIDSLSVTGNVLNSHNLEAEKNILILMHRELADSAPRKMLPEYLTQSDINGGFRINNIKEGKYRLYALQDNNNNKKYDLADEIFAFMDSVAVVVPEKNYLPPQEIIVDTVKADKKKPAEIPLINGEYKLFLFSSAKKAHYLTSSGRKMPYQLTYTLSLPPDTSKFEFTITDPGKKDFFMEKNLAGDTIIVWLLDSSLYSKQQINTLISYPFTDSTGALVYRKDSIPIRFIPPRAPRGKAPKNTYKYTTNIMNNSLKPGQHIIFSSETPFRQPDTSRIMLYETTTPAKKRIQYELIKDTSKSTVYYLNSELKEAEKYLLITDSAAFGNIYGNVTDSTGINFSVRPKNSYGRLTVNIQNGEGDLIVQLLTNKENIVAEKKLKNQGPAEFPMIEKGNYRLRVIYDLNGDGMWTTGDYNLKRQPEPVSYYPGEIEIKIDWEIQQDWDVGIRNVKDQKLKARADSKK
jgi:uncharacterized protein (DUF2141 family)